MKFVPTTTATLLLFCFLFVCDLAAQVPAKALLEHGDTYAQLVSAPEAKYPDIAREAFIWGKVNVRVFVNPDGTVKTATAEYGPGDICTSYSSPPITALRDAAVEAARAAKFRPAKSELQQYLSFEFPKPEGAETPAVLATGPVGRNGSPGIINSQATSLPKPAFPAAARAVRASGEVEVLVLIMEDGTVYSAKAVGGHPLLQRTSEIAACSAKFSTMINGSPAKLTGIVSYRFTP